MKKLVLSALPLLFVGLAATSCNGTTGDQLITFPAYAAGAKGASEPFSSNGYTIQLTFAQMWIGAVYIDESPLATGAESPICTNPGIYAAQVPFGVEVNLLSTELQPFGAQDDAGIALGNGTADLGQSWELWLVDGDVNAPSNSTYGAPNIVDLQGTARRQADGAVFSWAATVNINQSNRGIPVSDPSQPGLNPICKQRILEESFNTDEQLFANGQLVVTVDPRGWFNSAIDFSTLPPVASDPCEIDDNSLYGNATYCIPDTSFGTGLGATQGATLFNNIYTGGPSAYSLSFSTL